MNLNARRRLVQRLDVGILLGLLLTSGLAALFFSTQFYAAEEEATAQVAAPTSTATPTATFTATPTLTATATRTATPTRTPPPSATVTPSPSATPWPTPEVSAPPPAYVGQAVVLTGQARPRDTIHVYDAQGQWLGGTLALADGRWALSLPPQSIAGTLELHLLAVSADGAKSAPVVVRVDVRPVPSATPTHTPSATPTASPTPSATLTYTPSATSTPTARPTATDTPTTTPSPTATHTATPSHTPSATPSASPTPSATPTVTASATPRPTVTATPTLPSPSPQAVAQVLAPTSGVTATHTATPTRKPSPTASPTVTPSPTYVPLAVPRIDDPASGAVYSPGALTVQGRASTGAEVTLEDAISGKVLGRAVADVSEWWKITATLDEEGEWALVAVVQSPDGTRLTSAPVHITIAPPLHPETGGVLTSTDPAASGRALTALLGLLLVAGGFSVFFAGRLVYLVARGRKRSS